METVEPHPLDFDWRYSRETVQALVAMVGPGQRCLCMGTPSVARRLDALGIDVLLVDRQPVQGVKRHLCIDPSYEEPPAGEFDVVFVDPPWYPEVLDRWLSWAGSVAKRDAVIVCSIWPESTRPSAAAELRQIFDALPRWAEFEVHAGTLVYDAPPFEQAAMRLPAADLNGNRRGDQLVIRPFAASPSVPPLQATERWQRLVIGRYQLALRDSLGRGSGLRIRPHPLANGWIWPSVSRRAKGRHLIDLWSSRNEVAIVDGSAELLQKLLAQTSGELSGSGLESDPSLRPLLDWHLATLNLRQAVIWTHLA